MAYTVLARKYRSQTFDDVIGQDPIAQTLTNAIKTNRVAHAFLFTGTRGVGKTTMARVLAKALNCLAFDDATTEPCCKCDSCIAINTGDDIDVIEIDGASNNGVEEVRKLRENAIYRPARARYKIYIIDEVHMLSMSAFNALLKILEEPPTHVKFILATTESNKVIATIQSRCQRFDFSNISPRLIAGQLKSILRQEKIKYEDDMVVPLAKMACGSMRDALSLLDRLISTGAEPLTCALLEEFLGCPDSEKIYNLIAEIADSNAAGTLAATEQLLSTGLSEVQIVDSLVDCMRDLMVAKSTGAETELLILTAQQRDRVCELAQNFDIAALVYNITALEKLRWAVKNSDNARALLEALVLRFALSEHFLNVDALLERLQAASSGPLKKKRQAEVNSETGNGGQRGEIRDSLPLNDLPSIKNKWQSIYEIIAVKLGNGIASLLKFAVPTAFDNGLLVLTFPASARVSKEMCESNGRIEQIESFLNEHCRVPVKVRLEIGADGPQQTESGAERPNISSEMRNQIANDPAVKMVLTEFGATITGIEEVKNT